MMTVAVHENACSAVSNGLDHAAVDDLAVRGRSEARKIYAERDTNGMIALGDDVTGIDDLLVEPVWEETQSSARCTYANCVLSVGLYKTGIDDVMLVAASKHCKIVISPDVNGARICERAVSTECSPDSDAMLACNLHLTPIERSRAFASGDGDFASGDHSGDIEAAGVDVTEVDQGRSVPICSKRP